MDCPRPIRSVLYRFYATWSSRTRPSMRIQRSEGLGSRLCMRSLAQYRVQYTLAVTDLGFDEGCFNSKRCMQKLATAPILVDHTL